MNFVNRGDLNLVNINILKIRSAFGEKMSFNLNQKVDDIEVNGQKITFVNPINAFGEVVNVNGFFEVTGQTSAMISTQCTSCLEPFAINLKGSLQEVYARSEEIIENSNPDSEMIGFEGDVIDIEPEVIKSLLIELPMRLVCSTECRGLCHRCGTNLNVKQCNCQTEDIDPRLAVLTKLKQ